MYYNTLMLITLKGNPQSTNHIYRNAGHRVYMTQSGKSLKTDYYYQLKQQWLKKPLLGDITLLVTLYFGDKRVRDIDNYNKILLDACTGILWQDDKQIHDLRILKRYDKSNPRIELDL